MSLSVITSLSLLLSFSFVSSSVIFVCAAFSWIFRNSISTVSDVLGMVDVFALLLLLDLLVEVALVAKDDTGIVET